MPLREEPRTGRRFDSPKAKSRIHANRAEIRDFASGRRSGYPREHATHDDLDASWHGARCNRRGGRQPCGARSRRREASSMVNEPSTLGFIGLGTMGGRMCRNLARKSGRPVIGYDTVSERIADCAGAGVRAGASVSEVAAAERTGGCAGREARGGTVRRGDRQGIRTFVQPRDLPVVRVVTDASLPGRASSVRYGLPVRGRAGDRSAEGAPGASPARRGRLHVP